MMVDLQSFQNAAQAEMANPGAVVFLQSGERDVTARSGFFARWTGRVRFVENHRVTGRFIEAMNRRYGAEIAGEIATARGLTGGLRRVRPLTARKVAEALRQADNLQAQVGQQNELLAECAQRIDPQGPSTESVRTEVERAVESRYGNLPDLLTRIDMEEIAAEVKRAIVAAGRDGTHRVSPGEARAIRADVVGREVTRAFGACNAADALARTEFDPRRRGSQVFGLLADGFARFVPALNYEEYTLTPDAAEQLYQRFEHAIASGRIPARQLDRDGALTALAREEVGRFLDERQAARAAVDERAYLPSAMKQAMLAEVSRDNTPPDLASRAVETGFLIVDDLANLAGPLQAEDLEGAIANVRLAMVASLTRSGARAGETGEELNYRRLWRVALASASEGQAREMLLQMAPDNSPLRGICEGARWYADRFLETPEHIRAARAGGDERSFKAAAGDLADILHGLWVILQERTGWAVDPGPTPAANGCPDDRAVAFLRNLGIPFPAPSRLVEKNPLVPLSKSSQTEMIEALEHHVRSNGRTHHTGLSRNCVDFLVSNAGVTPARFKARFFVDGTELPRDAGAPAVIRALQEFCTDRDGNLNANMLAGVSRMVDHATLECVYAGCMNPDRPDLAIMDGYPEGVYEGHSYSLWKNDRGEVRLGIAEVITPLLLHAAHPHGDAAGEGQRAGAAQQSSPVTLSPRESDFRARVVVAFDPESYEPEFSTPEIGYSLIPGGREKPYWIEPAEAEAAEEVSEYESVASTTSDYESPLQFVSPV